MVQKIKPMIDRVALSAMLCAYLSAKSALAQFVPGHIFVVHPTFNFCETDDDGVPIDEETIYEMNPETGESRVFAKMPRELCGGLGSPVVSPDGKKLRVSSSFLGIIWEFDAQANRTVALDSSDGVYGPGGCNGSAYDKEGNFYTSNSPYEILRFPAGGGPPIVIANYWEDGVLYPNSLSVGPDGEVYAIAGTNKDTLYYVSPDGHVLIFDSIPHPSRYLESVVVNDYGDVYLRQSDFGAIFRYSSGGAESREVFPLQCGVPGGICVHTLTLSPDRNSIYASASSYPVVSIDPEIASFNVVVASPSVGSTCGLAVVPFRADVDGNGVRNLNDLEVLLSCTQGPGVAAVSDECGLADMDADGDVDLLDVRFFLRAHSALRN